MYNFRNKKTLFSHRYLPEQERDRKRSWPFAFVVFVQAPNAQLNFICSCCEVSEERQTAMESPFKADILKGKVALLTGGASGIGYEISHQLGKHGASIAIMGRRSHVLEAAVDSLQSHGIPVIFFFSFTSSSSFLISLVCYRIFVYWVSLSFTSGMKVGPCLVFL
jgi:hypothetical protein